MAVFKEGMSFSEDTFHSDREGEEFATLTTRADGGGVLIGEGICMIGNILSDGICERRRSMCRSPNFQISSGRLGWQCKKISRTHISQTTTFKQRVQATSRLVFSSRLNILFVNLN